MPSILEERKALALRTCRDNFGTSAVLGVRELCECLVESWRDELERAKPEACQKLQGKILGIRELLGEMQPPQPAQVDEDEN